MRASLGFRAGPLYVSTGNMAKSKPRKHSGGEILVWVVLTPFLLVYFLGVALWWLAAVSWRRSPQPADRVPTEPADDPTWKGH